MVAVGVRAYLPALAVLAFTLLEVQSPRIGGPEGHRIVQPLVVAGLLACTALRLYGNQRLSRPLLRNASAIIFGAYVTWCFVSTMWSRAPRDSVAHASVLLLSGVVGVLLAAAPRDKVLLTYVRVAIVVMCASWLFVASGHPAALTTDVFWRLQGVMRHAQRLALIAGSALIVLVAMRHDWRSSHRLLWFSGVALSFTTLIATGARAFTASAFVVIALHVARRGLVSTIAVVGAGAAVVVLWDQIVVLGGSLVSRGGSDYTLTGRVSLWIETLAMIRENPWLGSGFGAYVTQVEERMTGWHPWHAHNMWLHAAAETGMIGAALLLLFFITIFRNGLRYSHALSQPSVAVLLATYALLAGVTGVAVGEKMGPLYGLLLLVSFQEALQGSKASRQTLRARSPRRTSLAEWGADIRVPEHSPPASRPFA